MGGVPRRVLRDDALRWRRQPCQAAGNAKRPRRGAFETGLTGAGMLAAGVDPVPCRRSLVVFIDLLYRIGTTAL